MYVQAKPELAFTCRPKQAFILTEIRNCHISEYTSLETIAELAEFISEHDELGAAILGHTGNNIEEARNVIEEHYHGEFSSEEDFAYYWIHEVDCGEIPEYLQHYIDYKSMAHDWFMSDFFSLEVNSKVHVFSH